MRFLLRACFLAVPWWLLHGTAAVVAAGAEAERAVELCASRLREGRELSQETLRSRRVGLWEALRKLEVACDRPEVDPRLAAEAAWLYFNLPEYSSLESELAVLEKLETRLEGVAGGEAARLGCFERRAAALEGLGQDKEALAAFESALSFARGSMGAGSVEEAKALLHLGQLYSNRFARSMDAGDRARAVEFGNEAVQTLWKSRGEKALRPSRCSSRLRSS
jgi:hypothetical protein